MREKEKYIGEERKEEKIMHTILKLKKRKSIKIRLWCMSWSQRFVVFLAFLL